MSYAELLTEASKNLVDFYAIMLAGDEYVPAADFHYTLSDLLLNGKGHFAIEAFRESGKSGYVLQAYPMYCLAYPDKNRSYIVIIKQNQRLAESKLKEIADTYLSHPILKGNVIKIKEQSVKVFEVEVMGFENKKHTIRFEAYGKGSAMRGLNWGTKRPQIVIGDDLQDLSDSISATVQEKDFEWFMSDVLPLGKNTRMFIIGNNLGDACLIEKIMDKKEALGFECMVIPALDLQGNPTWEKQFSKEMLEKEKSSYIQAGKLDVWFRERMCLPMSDESRTFKKEYLGFFEEADLQGKDLKYFISVDPAISQKAEADNTAIVVVGKEHSNPNWYVVEVIAKKLSPSEIIDLLFILNAQYRPIRVGIETVAYQQALSHFLTEEMKRRQIYMNVEELKNTTKKEERILGLEPLFKTGVIKMRKHMTILQEELLSFPKGSHDDTIDSLSNIKQIIDATQHFSTIDAQKRYLLNIKLRNK